MVSGTHRASGSALPAFDKTRVVITDRVTNDTDNAVISSEDESELVKSVASLTSQPNAPVAPKAPRRSSFLSELQHDGKRKMSLPAISAPMNSSQPSTPSTENKANPWSLGHVRAPLNGSPTAWSAVNSIWNDAAMGQPLIPTRSRGESHSPNAADVIPFSIPLHPTPKTYRSQSYSVGQMDAELAITRGSTNAIKHKPSRLNEMEHAPVLDEVHEGDDEGSDAGVPLESPRFYNERANPVSILSRPRAAFPQDDVMRSPLDAPLRPVDSARADSHLMFEEDKLSLGNQLSQLSLTPARPHPQWQSPMRFESALASSVSRRHSLADVPTRRGSFANDAPDFGQVPVAYAGEGDNNYHRHAAQVENSMVQSDFHNRNYAQSYFSGTAPATASKIETTQGHPPMPAYRGLPGQQLQQRPGPPSGVFNRPGYDTPLYIVAFKCARADIYYVQADTGLEVNEGDLVMVEADRGYDLGTVTHARVSWAQARELKEKALDEHYRWLMMFSRHNQEMATADSQNMGGLMAQKGSTERDVMRKARESFGLHAQYSYEIKPRMIKRIAFNHEIANLREKEGNEAKAKRTCQQKAREHGCSMEILDAEFQIDWKKLTFYFYAVSYINFNALVTDLYKIYKVRIWLSAINPNTYPSPANKPPSTIGPGAMEGRDTPTEQNLTSIHDPDPDGAVPPSMNPNSNTYKELRKDAAARGYSPATTLNPTNLEFVSRFGPAGFPRAPEQTAASTLQPPRSGPTGTWGGFNLGSYDVHSNDRFDQAQTSNGDPYNQNIARFPPAPGFNTVAPHAGMNSSPVSYQPWNGNGNIENQPPTRGLNPLSHPTNFGGGGWARGSSNLNFGQVDRKK